MMCVQVHINIQQTFPLTDHTHHDTVQCSIIFNTKTQNTHNFHIHVCEWLEMINNMLIRVAVCTPSRTNSARTICTVIAMRMSLYVLA